MENKPCKFKAPTQQAKLDAVCISSKDTDLKSYFDAITPKFNSIPEPRPIDWLWSHKERNQTYNKYLKCDHYEKEKDRQTIYIQPCEEGIDPKLLEILQEFTSCYFHGMQVKINSPLCIDKKKIQSREKEGNKQYKAMKILYMLKKRLPFDAYCMIGVVTQDLYFKKSSSWLYGLASATERTGIFSFARYDESFFDKNLSEKTDPQIIYYRSCRVLAHEVSHMFGLKHCTFYHCIMNGSFNEEEASQKPLGLCPVCLRKLQSNIKFSIKNRYQAMLEFIERHSNTPFDQWKSFYETVYNLVKDLPDLQPDIELKKKVQEEALALQQKPKMAFGIVNKVNITPNQNGFSKPNKDIPLKAKNISQIIATAPTANNIQNMKPQPPREQQIIPRVASHSQSLRNRSMEPIPTQEFIINGQQATPKSTNLDKENNTYTHYKFKTQQIQIQQMIPPRRSFRTPITSQNISNSPIGYGQKLLQKLQKRYNDQIFKDESYQQEEFQDNYQHTNFRTNEKSLGNTQNSQYLPAIFNTNNSDIKLPDIRQKVQLKQGWLETRQNYPIKSQQLGMQTVLS